MSGFFNSGVIIALVVGVAVVLLLVILSQYRCREQCGFTPESRLRSQGEVIAPSNGNRQQVVYTPVTSVGGPPIMYNYCHACQAQMPCSTCVPSGQWNASTVYHPYPGANAAGTIQSYCNQPTPPQQSYPQPSAPPSTSTGTASGYTPCSSDLQPKSGYVSSSPAASERPEITGLPPSYDEAVHAQTPSAPSMET